MNRYLRTTFLCAIAVGLLLAASPVMAQETTSSLRGTVVDATGGRLGPCSGVSRRSGGRYCS